MSSYTLPLKVVRSTIEMSSCALGSVVGATVGAVLGEGAVLGSALGATVGSAVGATVGAAVGAAVGSAEGASLGSALGSVLGAALGLALASGGVTASGVGPQAASIDKVAAAAKLPLRIFLVCMSGFYLLEDESIIFL